ncbi:MAG: hypothetical protein K8R54_12215 [Bacteroidales bacterium]|nr:hypothetical protein [Bacteroidales bacterium]
MKQYILIFSLSLIFGCNIFTVERSDYRRSGKIKQRCNYIAGTSIKHGKCVVFTVDGDTLNLLNYKNNKLHGLQYTFYDNHNLFSQINFKNGMSHGIKKVFYENGVLEYKVEFKKGLLWNVFIQNDITGKILPKNKFINGNGYICLYSDKGELYEHGNVINGKAHGWWTTITSGGNVDSSFYENGIWDGLEIDLF